MRIFQDGDSFLDNLFFINVIKITFFNTRKVGLNSMNLVKCLSFDIVQMYPLPDVKLSFIYIKHVFYVTIL